ncbi:MAG: acetate kinase [Actinomycetia bacterium]|nr:acetate kinase [Actinomycetes bacterium]
MKVLVINSGSSSIKYRLYDESNPTPLVRGAVSRIGQTGSTLDYTSYAEHQCLSVAAPTHEAGLRLLVDSLLDERLGVVRDVREIGAVGHRAVHGGSAFRGSVLIDDAVIRKMEECVPLAPLHNPPNLVGIRAARKILPHAEQVAVFDTAFHSTMPAKAFLYALPYEYYERYGIRRYGFHGTSYRYVLARSCEILRCKPSDVRMIVAHLGNGSSMVAIDQGRSIDTSMGLTPLEGLMMGSRSGDIDPGVIFHLRRELGMGVDQIDELLNTKSGLLGVSGVSNDVRDLVEGVAAGNERCAIALDMFAYRAKKYIGAYAAALGGLDVMVFTGGIGENSALVREMICADLGFLGLELDEDRNTSTVGAEGTISADSSRVRILVVPTDEEWMIMQDTLAIVRSAAHEPKGYAHARIA